MNFYDMIFNFDNSVLSWIQLHLRNEFLDSFFIFFTTIGNSGFIWIGITLLFLFIPKYRKCGIMLAISLLLCVFIGEIGMKNIFQRLRPFHSIEEMKLLIHPPAGYSFPSGHTASSVASSIVLWQSKNKLISITGSILALLIAFSRLYLLVHYPTDILGGILLGGVVSCSVILIDKKRSRKK